jgi:alanyl-tRNA synthetase
VRFRATLKRGIKILEERFDDMRSEGHKELPSAVAADLYTTYGFPLDLTEVICAEAGFDVDVAGPTRSSRRVRGRRPIDPNAALDPIYTRDAKARAPRSFSATSTRGRERGHALVRVTREGDGDARGRPPRARGGDRPPRRSSSSCA